MVQICRRTQLIDRLAPIAGEGRLSSDCGPSFPHAELTMSVTLRSLTCSAYCCAADRFALFTSMATFAPRQPVDA
jgi:hypothetical protein